MKSSVRRLAAITAVAIGAGTAALTGVPTGAFAATTPTTPAPAAGSTSTKGATLNAIRTRAAAAVSLRVNALQAAITDVGPNRYATASDRATILTTLQSDLAGMNTLGPEIQADTTVATAESGYRSIFTQFRVFALALPQARLAASADDLTGTVVPRLSDARTRLQSLLAGADSGKDTPAVQAAMADLSTRISGIGTATDGLTTAILGYTPAQWNAAPGILAPWKTKLVTARADTRSARSDVETVVEAIR